MFTNPEIIKKIRDKGVKVRVRHLRKYDENWAILSRGGRTDIKLIIPDKDPISVHANCSEADNFSRKKGLAIALGRAVKSLKQEGILL